MRYAFYLPTRGRTATASALETLLTRGEALGFTSVMIADHVVFPTRVASKYPYTVSGAFPGQGDAYSGHREHRDRSIVNASIGRS